MVKKEIKIFRKEAIKKALQNRKPYPSLAIYTNHYVKDSNFLSSLYKWERDKSFDYAVNNEIKIIGSSSQKCPYCGLDLLKFPKAKTKCKKCENYIYKRVNFISKDPMLLKENELEEYEKQKNRYYFIKKHCFPEYKELKISNPNLTFEQAYIFKNISDIKNMQNKNLWHEAAIERIKLICFYEDLELYEDAIKQYLEKMYIECCNPQQGIFTHHKKGYELTVKNKGFHNDDFYKESFMKDIQESNYNLLFVSNICRLIKRKKYSINDIKNMFLNLDFSEYKMPRSLIYVWNEILKDRFIYLEKNDWDDRKMNNYKPKSSLINRIKNYFKDTL